MALENGQSGRDPWGHPTALNVPDGTCELIFPVDVSGQLSVIVSSHTQVTGISQLLTGLSVSVLIFAVRNRER
jgi:hypothetical protein